MKKLPTIPATKEVIGYIARYGGHCRDCADQVDGVCPNSKLPCDWRAAQSAIRHVIRAYNYGIKNGFLKSRP